MFLIMLAVTSNHTKQTGLITKKLKYEYYWVVMTHWCIMLQMTSRTTAEIETALLHHIWIMHVFMAFDKSYAETGEAVRNMGKEQHVTMRQQSSRMCIWDNTKKKDTCILLFVEVLRKKKNNRKAQNKKCYSPFSLSLLAIHWIAQEV